MGKKGKEKSFNNRFKKNLKRMRMAGRLSRIGWLGGPVTRIVLFLWMLFLPFFLSVFVIFTVIFMMGGFLSAMEAEGDQYGVTRTQVGQEDKSGRGMYVPAEMEGTFFVPLENSILTSRWQDNRCINGTCRPHRAWDLQTKGMGGGKRAVPGGDVMPIYPGEVIVAERRNGFGDTVVLSHRVSGKEYYSLYGHLHDINVSVGDHVGMLDTLGREGGDGNDGNGTYPVHVHLEVFHGEGWSFNFGSNDRTANVFTVSEMEQSFYCPDGHMENKHHKDVGSCGKARFDYY